MALRAKAKGFQYKPRTVTQIKERATRKASRFDSIYKQGVDTHRSKPGDNLFRYLPPTWDDADHYGYTIYTHYGVGADGSTYLCLRKMLNKPCPVCEAEKELKDAGEEQEAKDLKASERIVSYILDRDGDDPEKPLVFEQSWTQDRDINALCVNERSGEILLIDHPDKGYDVSFKKQGTGKKGTRYFGYQIAREDSPIHDSEKVQDEILDYVKENPIPELLNYYDYDYLKAALSGVVPEKDDDLDGDEHEEKPAKNTRSVREEAPFDEEETKPVKRGPRRDQELDEGDEEEEVVAGMPKRRIIEEEYDKPAPKSKSRRVEPMDEPEDEEAEETVVRKPVASKPSAARSRVVEEVDEEDEPAPPRRSRLR